MPSLDATLFGLAGVCVVWDVRMQAKVDAGYDRAFDDMIAGECQMEQRGCVGLPVAPATDGDGTTEDDLDG